MDGKDPVNPGHYKGDTVMVVIEQFGLGFCLGNVVKYVLRAKDKNGVEDLKKANWYLQREIATQDPEAKTMAQLQQEVDDLRRQLLHRDKENTEYSQAITAACEQQVLKESDGQLSEQQEQAKRKLLDLWQRDRTE